MEKADFLGKQFHSSSELLISDWQRFALPIAYWGLRL